MTTAVIYRALYPSLLGLCLIAVLPYVTRAQNALDSSRAPSIHIIAASEEYDAPGSLRAFVDDLRRDYRFTITGSWSKDHAKQLDGLEHLPAANLLVLFARRLALDPESLATVQSHWQAGKPVIGIRTASHAFSDEVNRVLDRQVFGNNYQGHHPEGACRITTLPGAADHPVLAGVGPIASRKLYKTGPLPKGALALQQGEQHGSTEVVTIVNQHRGARVCYTSLGTQEDFDNPDFVRLLRNAVFWTLEQDAAQLERSP